MITKESKKAVFITIVVVLFLGSISLAREGVKGPNSPEWRRGGKGSMMVRMKEKLGLTEEQAEKVKKLRSSKREQMASAHEAIRTQKKAVEDAVWAGGDEKSIRAAATKLGKAIGDKAVQEAAHVKAMKGILTGEQFGKWQEIKKEWGHRRRGRFGEHRGRKGHGEFEGHRRYKGYGEGKRCEGYGEFEERRGRRGHREFEGREGYGRPRDIEGFFSRKDSDGNGKLSIEEFTRRGRKTEEDFKKADTDGDGSLSVQEFTAFAKEFKGRRGRERRTGYE